MTKTRYAVWREPGTAWRPALDMEEQSGWEEHAAFMNALAAEGFAIMAGPLEHGDEILLVVEAENEGAVRKRLAGDPWTTMQILTIERITPWHDKLSANGD